MMNSFSEPANSKWLLPSPTPETLGDIKFKKVFG